MIAMQWFRNIQLYRLPAEYRTPTTELLNQQLTQKKFRGCSSSELTTQGWVAPAKHAPDLLAYPQQGAVLIRLQTEEKLLPTSVVKQFVEDKIAEIEAHDHRKVGKKERRELMENTRQELLPRAFSRQRSTMAIIDLQHHFIMVDSANATRAEALLSALREALGTFPARLIHTTLSPVTAMTTWLEHSAPPHFTLDADCELREAGEAGAIVRYQRQNLDADEVKNHLIAGKIATQLAMSWREKISFILTDKFVLKRISMLDLLADTLPEQDREGEDGLFDANFTLMLGEFRLLLPELIAALGNEEV
jgi:recombination associated protein RdgC